MKKFLLSLATVLCASAFASAADVTFTFFSTAGTNNYGMEPAYTDDNTKYIANGATATQGDITLTLGETTNTTNSWRNWSDGLRAYGKKKKPTLKVSAANGSTITAIDFSLKATMTITADKGKMKNTTSNKSNSWSGSASDVTFTLTGANVAIQVLKITYTKAGGTEVAAPTISPVSGRYTEAQTVTITGAEGTTVYYTLDGTEPTDGSTKYVTAFTVDKTTTVKAIAYDADDNTSSVVSVSYTIVPPLPDAEGDGTETNPYNAAAAINACNAGSAATGVYVKGTISKIDEINVQYGNATYYISDNGTETNQFNIFRGKSFDNAKFTSEDALKVGDKVVVKGDLELYNGVTPELKNSQLISLNDTTGVEGIEIDENAPVEYYNLQGVRVENPANGLYIMRQGDKVVKVIK